MGVALALPGGPYVLKLFVSWDGKDVGEGSSRCLEGGMDRVGWRSLRGESGTGEG